MQESRPKAPAMDPFQEGFQEEVVPELTRSRCVQREEPAV